MHPCGAGVGGAVKSRVWESVDQGNSWRGTPGLEGLQGSKMESIAGFMSGRGGVAQESVGISRGNSRKNIDTDPWEDPVRAGVSSGRGSMWNLGKCKGDPEGVEIHREKIQSRG